MNLLPFYYSIKPMIPRRMQIITRRWIAFKRLQAAQSVWPINELCSRPRDGAFSWPENKKFGLILTHDVEHFSGLVKCRLVADLEHSYRFRSVFNFVPYRYPMDYKILTYLQDKGFEIGVHDLRHDGKLFESENRFNDAVPLINNFLKEWGATGFRGGSMHSNLEWLKRLDIHYDMSTFDTDPFEPYNNPVSTIFPFWVKNDEGKPCYLELPYTLPQDFSLFVIMQRQNIDIWKMKLDWIASKGGMALLITHPDYMSFSKNHTFEEYDYRYYEQFLRYINNKYHDLFWHGLPQDLLRYYKKKDERATMKNHTQAICT
ncbi:MAG: hypothetical protein JW795_03060 [Chitinivibrionales bacterium]|nr:hypothetical protein [Chitinivibrionales bacterium]